MKDGMTLNAHVRYDVSDGCLDILRWMKWNVFPEMKWNGFPAMLVEHFVKKKPVTRSIASSPGILVAQWLEHPPGDTEVVALIFSPVV